MTLSAKGSDVSVSLTGLEGGTSTVQTNGIVETYETGNTNNGWQKVEQAFTLSEAEVVTVTLSSSATKWQLGALKVLPSTTMTKATTGVDLANAYVDVRGVSDFSFFERGDNRNALIKAAAGTLPAQLPYNVIVDGVCANMQLTDGDYSFNNSGEAFTASSVSYDRSFTPQNRSTICLPFALTAAEAEAAGTFWRLESYDAETGEIRFEKVNEPAANTPYIFEAAGETTNPTLPFLSLTSKTVPASLLNPVTVSTNDISFVGVNEKTHLVSGKDLSGYNAAVTYYGYKDGAFVQAGTTGGAYINPFRAYLMTPISPQTTSNVRIKVLFDGEIGETGIQVVKPEVKSMKEQPIYNMSGQRVKTPSKKGIYIIGGKKIVK